MFLENFVKNGCQIVYNRGNRIHITQYWGVWIVMNYTEKDQLAVHAIRTLSIDAVEKANSGHPGMPMGAAPMAYVLWTRFMRHNPANPAWPNRDRFVLSAGHGSMLLYSLLHLSGYDLSLDELKNFRQWGSKAPGHPEYGMTPGVETTTGPLGQGFTNAVGFAMAERFLAHTFNKPEHTVIDHYTYTIVGDGDLMEGVTAEAASLAGHLKLDRLIVLYDSNDISLDGETNKAFTEDVAARFRAYGWHVLRVEDGNDLGAIHRALEEAKNHRGQPTLIEVKTHIGYGSPNKQDTAAAHGAPLGEEEVKLTKQTYQWEHPPFHVPDEAKEAFRAVRTAGEEAEREWEARLKAYEAAYPEEGQKLRAALHGNLPKGWEDELPRYRAGDKLATRNASGDVLNAVAPHYPTLLGGSADLSGSNKTTLKQFDIYSAEDYSGRNVWYGVREHAMGGIMNGLALHGGVRPYGGTFLVFSDYLRPSIRLAALMDQPVVYVFTHDSIGVGEDGPTHQPVEHLAALRAIPNLTVLRPGDAVETAEAWRYVLSQTHGPAVLALSRQGLPVLEGTVKHARDGVRRGAYIVEEAANGDPAAIVIATGSELHLAVQAQQRLAEDGIHVRVVSMPSWELFEQQDEAYRNDVLPPAVTKRLAVEAGSSMGWERYVGAEGDVLGIDRFGESAPGNKVMEAFGFTVENVVARLRELL
jgi:transketolase